MVIITFLIKNGCKTRPFFLLTAVGKTILLVLCHAKQLLALATSLERLHDKQLLLGNYAFCMDYVVVCYQGQISRNVFTKFRVVNYLRHLRKHLMWCNRLILTSNKAMHRAKQV
jgi:hypothetical protein